MMLHEFSRSARVVGQDNIEKLARSKVAIFGVGGVGSFAAEAIARAGVGTIILVDNDTVSLTNINRQLVALHSTIGEPKVLVMKNRIIDINPRANVLALQLFYCEDTASAVDLSSCDYVIDAIDTVSAKLLLIENAKNAGIPIISSMGTGNKLQPELLCITDIYRTSVCPLARVMRTELRKRNIPSLDVVFSSELPKSPIEDGDTPPVGRRQVPGSISFVPPVAGMLAAGHVVRSLISI